MNVRPGFLLMEVLLGISIFGLLLSAVGLTMLYGQEGTVDGGDRARGVAQAQQALEGVRNIRFGDLSALTNGQHGVAINPTTGKWVLSGSVTTSGDVFNTWVNISTIGTDHLQVEAESRWRRGYGRSGSVLLTTEITDWAEPINIGDWSNITQVGQYTASDTPQFRALAVSGDYAYLGGEIVDGGAGLYVIDISTISSPSRVASSFNLGEDVVALALKDQRLYVINSATSAEVSVYDISNPSSFSSSNLVTSYNLPGDGLGRSALINGDTLYVGAQQDATSGYHEFYSFDISNSGSIVLRDSIDDTSSINGIALSGTSAYLATDDNAAELKVADVTDPDNMAFATTESANVSDVQDASSIALSGTAAILGRENGAAIEEFVVFRTENGGLPPPPPGPWYKETGEAVRAIAGDVTGCHAFVASAFSTKELQIINVSGPNLAELASDDVSTGEGRAIYYDILEDRLYLATQGALHIYDPGASSSACE